MNMLTFAPDSSFGSPYLGPTPGRRAMRRRLLLLGGLLLPLGVAVTAASGWMRSHQRPTVPGLGPLADVPNLSSSLFTDSDETNKIGQIYLGQLPQEEANVDRLEDVLGGESLHSGQDGARLMHLINDDVSNGRLLSLDGRMVTRTEARLAALAVLQH